MRPRGRLRFWALLVALLLAIPVAAAAIYSSGSADSVSIGDQLSASLLQPFADAASFGDSLSAYLISTFSQPISDAASFGDSLVAQLVQPYSDAMTFGDTLVATLVQPYADAVNFGDSLLATLVQPYTDAVNFGDTLVAKLSQPYGDAMNIGDSVLAQLMQPFNDSITIGDQISTTLLSAFNTAVADAVQIGDQISTGLLTPVNDAVAIEENFSSVKLSISGATGTQVTTDQDGNTLITATGASGAVITQVSLPPGTTTSASAAVNYAVEGQNSIVQASGFTVPYPPGKSITILDGPGVSTVCIVDSPQGASLQEQACGATDLSSSHVILACDGSPHTFAPFPSWPASRTYTCTRTTQGGQVYLEVTGLAFSTTIVDGTPPTLSLPPDITRVLTSRLGAPVTFSVTATDPLDPNPSVACSAKSGSIFPIGTTTVSCTATDAVGNEATGSFSVSVVYNFGGFLPPLQSGASYHLGSVIPVKFELKDADGNLVRFATARIEAGPVTGTFRLVRDHYQFDLETRGMQPGPLTITAILDDGTTHSITVYLTTAWETSTQLSCYPSTILAGATTHCEALTTSEGGPAPGGKVLFASSETKGSFGAVACDTGGEVLTCRVDYSSATPGDQTITATYPGDSNDLPSSGTFELTVSPILTSTNLACSPTSAQPGKQNQCVAVVASQDGSAPTGTVSFTSTDPHGTFGGASCAPTGGHSDVQLTCKVDYTPSSGASQTITATYSGDATHSPSSAEFRLSGSSHDTAAPAPALALSSVAGAIGMGVPARLSSEAPHPKRKSPASNGTRN